MNYRLTVRNIKENLDGLKAQGEPLFRFVKNHEQAWLSLDDFRDAGICPLEDTSVFRADIESHFSRDENAVYIPMNNANLLYFLMGGNRRIVSDNTYMSRLINANLSSKKFYDLLLSDLVNWKLAPCEDGGRRFVNCSRVGIPEGAVSLVDYIVQENDLIISNFCSRGAQTALRGLLRAYAGNISGAESKEPEWADEIKPEHVRLAVMDPVLVETLSNLLEVLAGLAEASESKGLQPRYLAEGLTWLFIASLLRGKLSAVQGELDRAVRSAHKAVDEMGRITPLGHAGAPAAVPGPKDDEEKLWEYLAEVLKQKRRSHPSFQLLTADEIDSRLYPNIKEYRQIEPRGTVPENTDKTNRETCPAWEIIRNSWSAPEHRNIVITGDGGIGKTVALFSIADAQDGSLPVPALYIPMYELVDKDGKILGLNEYILKKYRKYSDGIETLATETWNEIPRLLVLLDGFNEIPFSLRRDALYAVNNWYDTHPGAQMVAVSRPMDGLNLAQELAGNPLPVELAPLEENTILEYLKEAKQKIPAKSSPIWKDLRYPLFLNLYVKTGRLKGKTPAGYPLRVMDADSGGALIWNFLQRELLRYINAEPEKAEDWVLRCAVANEYILPYLAYRMVSEQRMKLARAQAVRWTDEVLEQFDSKKLPTHLAVIWDEYEDKHYHIPDKDIYSHQIWKDTVLRDSGILVPLIKQDNETTPSTKSYVFMHQHFRDCLAGLYLVNEAETAEDNKLPSVWKQGQNHLALDYAAELMDGKTADRLWEINRLTLQYDSPGYVKDHSGTYALLELEKRRRPMPADLDFSGMDMSGLSLARYMRQNDNNLSLFNTSQHSRNTKFDRSVFQGEGHSFSILCILSLPDGRIVSGSSDNSLRVWDPSTGQCLMTFKEHTGSISCVAVLNDGRVVSGSVDHSLRVWNPSTGQCLMTLKEHTNSITCVAVLNDGRIVSGSRDNSLRVWDPSTGLCLKTLEGHTGYITCVAVLNDGRIVSGSRDNSLRVWDPSTGQCLMTLEGHTGNVECVAVLNDGRVLSCSGDNSMRVWDPSTGQMALEEHILGIRCVAVLNDGRVASGSFDGSLQVWDPSTGQCLMTLKGHTSPFTCVTVLNDGRVVSGSFDGSLQVWDLSTGQCLKTLERHTMPISCVTALNDGRVVSGSWDFSLRFWDPSTGQCLMNLEGHTDSFKCVAVLNDGRVVSGSWDNSIRVWDSSTGQCLMTLEGHTGNISCVAVLNDGRVVSGSRDNSIRVWDSSTGQCLMIFEGHTGNVECVAVLNDGRVVSGSYDQSLRVWDPSTGQCLMTLKGHTQWISCVAVLPDGRIVSGSYDQSLRVWDLSTGQCLMTLKGHTQWINCVAVLPDGRVVSGSNDQSLRVWDPSTGQCLMTLKGHTQWINCVAVLPDGRVASGSNDPSLRVWDPSTGRCLMTLEGHTGSIECVAILNDGRVVSGSADCTIKIWTPDTGECIETIEKTEVDVSQMDLSNAILTKDLAKLLWQNGAKVPKPNLCEPT